MSLTGEQSAHGRLLLTGERTLLYGQQERQVPQSAVGGGRRSYHCRK
jgi:hypothetical protein